MLIIKILLSTRAIIILIIIIIITITTIIVVITIIILLLLIIIIMKYNIIHPAIHAFAHAITPETMHPSRWTCHPIPRRRWRC